MCHGAKVLAMVMILAKTKSESTQDQRREEFTNDGFGAHSTLDLSRSTTTEDDGSNSEEEVSVIVDTQLAEFYSSTTAETTLTPVPRLSINLTTGTSANSGSAVVFGLPKTNAEPMTEEPDIPIIVPVDQLQPRGVLDLLFPPKRVESFKMMFNSIKRMLSFTFRR